ncbi:ATP-binding protein [Streptomyces subrutilus]|uniref:AAA+ ATPase domain-containing protein n=1 Tax=Streptomyces subrutilus TaxID=36818 RepID=A0A1E5NXL3_9ACTN|nr:ATP-binding protein [Streptomyces subrutilus]OEJ21006.1 hypothetical protein BGK67_34485 [Streptomyces subrutilus]
MTVALETTPIAAGREPRRLFEITPKLLETLRRGGADMSQLGIPAQPEPEDGLWDNVSVPQARALKNIWISSMREAAHDDYLRFRFKHLDDPQQKPKSLERWLDTLVQAKRDGVRPEVLNLIMPGPIGSGKTTAAAALGNEASERGLVTLLVKHATYLAWRRPDGSPDGQRAYQVRKRHVEADLLILDELAGEMDGTATEFARRETVDLIDSRLAAGRPTAYTTNLRSRGTGGNPGIVDILGERLLSRIESRAHVLKIIGEDRRKPKKDLDW